MVWVRLKNSSSVESVRSALEADPRYPVEISSEAEVLESRHGAPSERIETFSSLVRILLVIGSALMSIAVTQTIAGHCARNIETLRILGFHDLTVALCLMGTVVILAVLGLIVGGAISVVAIDGLHSSTVDGYGLQTSFEFRITWLQMSISSALIILVCMVLALATGATQTNSKGRPPWLR